MIVQAEENGFSKSYTKNRRGQEKLSTLKHEVNWNSNSGSSLTEELFECQSSN